MRRAWVQGVVWVGLLVGAVAGCDRGDRPGAVGQPAPVLQVGGINLAQYRGHVVLVHFWASWCVYCAAEFPPLTELEQRLPNLVVLAVSFDHDPEAYRQYLADNHITLRTAVDPTERANRAFGTTRPPETYVIDPQGIIRRRFIGAQNWNDPEIVGYLKAL